MYLKPKRNHVYNKSHGVYGFTMTELLATVAVMSVLVALAAPNFSKLIKKNRLTNKGNDLVVAMNIARQTAISRSLTTFVCHSNNADTASPTCGGGSNSGWNTGFIVYSVAPRTLVTAQRNYTSSSDTLVHQTNLLDDDKITVTDNNANAASFISFGADGLLFASTAIQLQVCDDRTAEDGTLVKISAAGRISTEEAAGDDACA